MPPPPTFQGSFTSPTLCSTHGSGPGQFLDLVGMGLDGNVHFVHFDIRPNGAIYIREQCNTRVT